MEKSTFDAPLTEIGVMVISPLLCIFPELLRPVMCRSGAVSKRARVGENEVVGGVDY